MPQHTVFRSSLASLSQLDGQARDNVQDLTPPSCSPASRRDSLQNSQQSGQVGFIVRQNRCRRHELQRTEQVWNDRLLVSLDISCGGNG